MLKGFRDFVLRGNIVELAIAVVIGTAFADLVKAFTEKIINPIVAAAGGGGKIGLGFQLVSGNPNTFVDLGAVLTGIITFLITAAVVYFVFVVPMNKISERRKRGEVIAEAEPTDTELLAEIRDLLRAQQTK